MCAKMLHFIVAIIVLIISLLTGFISWKGGQPVIKGAFMDVDNIPSIRNIATQIVNGTVNYENVRTLVKANIHEEILCGSKGLPGQMVIWDPVNNLKKSCSYGKKSVVDPQYKLTYKLRDLLTTTYVRSLDSIKSQHRAISGSKRFALQLLKTFNDGLEILKQTYVQRGIIPKPDSFKILYKGGNVIATYSRVLYEKLYKHSSSGEIDRIINKKMNELARGDWDYTTYIDHDIIVGNAGGVSMSSIRSHVLFMLQEIKKYMDVHNIFHIGEIARKLAYEFHSGQDVKAILNEYRESTKTNIIIEQVQIPGHLLINGKVVAGATPITQSKFSLKRSDVPANDAFEVNTLLDPTLALVATENSIGFTEGLVSKITYLVSDFDLARVKINNKVTFNIDNKKIEKNLSADIIDMSFLNPGDTKSDYVHEKCHKISMPEWTMRQVEKYYIPFLTPHYLFYDLCSMIIEESVYPWADKKYAKRLERLVNMGVLSSIIRDGMHNTRKYINTLDKCVNDIAGADVDAAYTTMSAYSQIAEGITFSINTNHFTHMMLYSIYKSLIFALFTSHSAKVTQEMRQFVARYLPFIYSGESTISVSEFSAGMDMSEYNKYIANVKERINLYKKIFSNIDDIKLTDYESLSIGDI
jgi:hypothetical protein